MDSNLDSRVSYHKFSQTYSTAGGKHDFFHILLNSLITAHKLRNMMSVPWNTLQQQLSLPLINRKVFQTLQFTPETIYCKTPILIPAFCLRHNFTNFLYSLGQLPITIVLPRFNIFPILHQLSGQHKNLKSELYCIYLQSFKGVKEEQKFRVCYKVLWIIFSLEMEK